MQFERKNNTICFSDTEGIDWNTWHKTLLLFQHLGYDFEDENEVKAYFDRHCPLQEDQSEIFLQILNKEHTAEKYPKELIQKNNLKAKHHYGTTLVFKKAGYLLTDGTMLDFSEGQWQRTLDHRDIACILDPGTDSYSDTMYQFITYGNIRIFNNGFHIIKRPKNIQWAVLKIFINQTNSVYVDISNENGHIIKHFEEEIITPFTFSKIRKNVTDYFNSITI